jgi:hypothetical protein
MNEKKRENGLGDLVKPARSSADNRAAESVKLELSGGTRVSAAAA